MLVQNPNWTRSSCKFGNECKFLHIKKNENYHNSDEDTADKLEGNETLYNDESNSEKNTVFLMKQKLIIIIVTSVPIRTRKKKICKHTKNMNILLISLPTTIYMNIL